MNLIANGFRVQVIMRAMGDLLIIAGFSFVLLGSCLFVARFGKNWNLKPLAALSSGALLSICFLEFVPHSFEMEGGQGAVEMIPLFILLGILIQGLADIYLIPRLTFLDRLLGVQHTHSSHSHAHALSPGSVCSMVGCLSVCSFFDGIRLFSALRMEGLVALETVFALFFHLLSEGVLVAVLALSSGIKKQALLVLVLCLSGAVLLGALLAQALFFNLSSHLLIAFASGILIYICFAHLLPFCFKQKQTFWFWIGLIVFSSLHFAI